MWRSLSIARWPIAGRGVVSLMGDYQDAVPGGGHCLLAMVWMASSLSHPGEQIGPPLHGRPQHEQPSSAASRACPGVLAAPTRVSCCRVEMTVTSRTAVRKCWPLNYLTFNLEPRGKKNLLHSDWMDYRLVCRNRT